MSAPGHRDEVAAALDRLRPRMPQSADEAAQLRARTREVDAALGALLARDPDEEA